ncbi:hypothetical protein [Endozoicomonas atrinae]|uniref:hypothetical protein n=1 Tax=Endozoicomonas atrinae TaxID=1333660 RepID=UPI003AFF73D2
MDEIAYCLTENWARDLSVSELQLVKSFPDILARTFTLLENDGLPLDQENSGVKNRLEKAKAIVNGVLGDLDTHDQKRSVRTKFSNILPERSHGRDRLALGLSLVSIIQNLRKLQ